jgi:NitT/TauT family transport system substrate-binding protein
MKKSAILAALAILAVAAPGLARAADALKVTVSHKDVFDAVFPHRALEQGFFKEQNLDVSFLYAAGGAETVQTIATGSVNVATTASVHSVIAAYAKGAPVRIIGSQIVGSPDIYWYVRTDGPIKKVEDLDGKNVAFSRQGSVSHMLIQNYAKQIGIKPNLIAGGGLPAVRTMLMTGQVDAAWGAVPFAVDGVRAGELKILFSADDIKATRDVVSRVTIANADYLKGHRDVVRRYQVAYQKSVDAVYADLDSALKQFAEDNKLEFETVRQASKYFGDKTTHLIAPLKNFDEAVKQSVEFGLINEPLTEAQKKELVDIVYDPSKS